MKLELEVHNDNYIQYGIANEEGKRFHLTISQEKGNNWHGDLYFGTEVFHNWEIAESAQMSIQEAAKIAIGKVLKELGDIAFVIGVAISTVSANNWQEVGHIMCYMGAFQITGKSPFKFELKVPLPESASELVVKFGAFQMARHVLYATIGKSLEECKTIAAQDAQQFLQHLVQDVYTFVQLLEEVEL